MQQTESTIDVWELALGFMDSQVLLSADALGVFDALDSAPRRACEVAHMTSIPVESAERLLTALCALRVVQRQEDGRYVNGPEASAQLVRGKEGYIGAMFEHVRDHLYPAWRFAREALVEGRSQWHRAFAGRPAPTESLYEQPRELRAFMDGMHVITYASARDFADRVAGLPDVRTAVDLGGASGAFLIALAERNRVLRGTVVDLPPVRPITEDYFRRHGVADRIEFHGANFWTDPIPEGADAYSLGFILHDWDTRGGSLLLERIADACPAGGLLIIGEYLLDDDRTGPLFVARQDLNMLVAAHGRERSGREYREWIADYGFDCERIELTTGGKSFIVARRRASASAPFAARRSSTAA